MIYTASGSIDITNNTYPTAGSVGSTSLQLEGYIQNVEYYKTYIVLGAPPNIGVPAAVRANAVAVDQTLQNIFTSQINDYRPDRIEYLYFDAEANNLADYPELSAYQRQILSTDQSEQQITYVSNLAANIEMVTSNIGTNIVFGTSRITQDGEWTLYQGNSVQTVFTIDAYGQTITANNIIGGNNLLVANNATIGSNLTVVNSAILGNVYTDNLFFANGDQWTSNLTARVQTLEDQVANLIALVNTLI